jgi:hypothetical protein
MVLALLFALTAYEHLSILLNQERYTEAIEHVENFSESDKHLALCQIHGLWGDGEQALFHCQEISGTMNDLLECVWSRCSIHAEAAWSLYQYYSAQAQAYPYNDVYVLT